MAEFQIPGLYVDNARSEEAADRPLLINRDPSPGEVGVPRAPVICLELVDLLDPPSGIDAGDTAVWINGALAWDDDSPEAGFDGPGTQQTQDARTYRICIEPEAPFASEQVVTVRVASSTNDGSSIDQSYTFTIEDFIAPALVAATATARREVTLSFAEAVQVTSGVGFTFERIGVPAVSLSAISAVADGSAVRVTVDKDMTPGVQYRVIATGVADLAGNPVAAPTDTATFNGFSPQSPAGRRFDLWSMAIPLQNRRDDTSGDLRRFIDVLQEIVDLLLCDIDSFCDIWSIERAPENFIDLILADLGNPFDFELDAVRKRRLAASLVSLYRQKGTAQGIIDAVNFFLGILVTVETLGRTGFELGFGDLAWPAFDESAAGPFDTEDGRTIIVSVNGDDQVVTFNAADVVDINAITVGEAVAIFNAQLEGAIAVAADGGTLQVRTTEQSPTATLQIVGGTALAAFGFSEDESTGGGDFLLGSNERRLLYSFRVISPVALTDEQRAQVEAIAEYMKPAHTHLIEVADPPAVEALDHWELGLSDLGEETDLH